MVKRKKARKAEEAEKRAARKQQKEPEKLSTPVPALMLKILAVVLSIILVIALTLFVLGRMPARGFFFLVILLAIIGFAVMPAMRKRFVGE